MITINGIPVYAANVFDAETGIFKVAICDNPAIQSGFQAFGEEKQILKYSVQDEEQRIVLGCLMRNSYPIYRRNADGFEYFIVYTKDTIEQMSAKWLASQNVNNINLNHQEGTDQDGIYLMQAFIKDSSKGLNPSGFEDIEDGSLFAQYKVMNDEVWAAIKDGTYVGFSLEGLFGVEPMNEEFNKQENNNNDNKESKLMTKLARIKEVLKSLLVEFGEVSTDKGVIVFDGDELEQGMAVHGIDEQGNEVALEDGEYRTEDKKIIVVTDGKVAEIRDDEAEVSTDEPAAEEPQENAEEPAAEEPSTEDEPSTDERDARIAELEARIAELEAENAQLREENEKLKEEPAAPNANEAFEALENKEDNSKVAQMRKRGYKI